MSICIANGATDFWSAWDTQVGDDETENLTHEATGTRFESRLSLAEIDYLKGVFLTLCEGDRDAVVTDLRERWNGETQAGRYILEFIIGLFEVTSAEFADAYNREINDGETETLRHRATGTEFVSNLTLDEMDQLGEMFAVLDAEVQRSMLEELQAVRAAQQTAGGRYVIDALFDYFS
jgi:hypothetical protein